MNLYHCATMYQVLEVIVHCERVHKGEYNVLLLADFSAKKYHDYTELEAFFDEVRLFPYRPISNDPDTVLEEVENAYHNSVPYDISSFEHIYVAAAYYSFSLYLIANNISFHMFEDGGGILSRPKVLYEIIRDVTPVIAETAQTYGLLDGRNECIRDVICNFSAQSYLSDDPKWKDFNPALEITRLSPETIRRILHFFRLEPIQDIPEDAVLVFTQQFANLFTTSLEDQIAIYQICSDFFLTGQSLIIKPHPDDSVDYTAFFPEARIIQGKFPAELMPVLLDRVPGTSFTVSSSSVRNIRSIFRKNIVCGYDFPNTFRAIDRYYFAAKLLSEAECLEHCPVHTYGVDVSLLECIAEHSLKIRLPFLHEAVLEKKADGRQVWLIDDITFESDYFQTEKTELSFAYRRTVVKGLEMADPPAPAQGADSGSGSDAPERAKSQADARSVSSFLEGIGEESLVIFLNSRDDYCFCDEGQKELPPGMIPLAVSKRRIREENIFFPDDDGAIFAYTLDAGIREEVMRFHAEIILKNTGLAEEIGPPDPQQGSAPSKAVIHTSKDRISMEEYLDLAMDLNDMSMKSFLMDKVNLFLRAGLGDYLHRPSLALASASDEDIRQFLRTWGKVVGKRNSLAGEGFRIYVDEGTDMALQIRSDGADILEPFIRQHHAYQAIYPDSLNTIRIHTVRSSKGVKTFLSPILSIGGDGAVVDMSSDTTRYRVLLSEDGSILRAFRQDPGESLKITERHHNTGFPFRQGRKLVGIPKCLECCREAAFYIPEMRYIGWDVAYTEDGPLIVEANNISGFIYAYQQAKECIAGKGARDEIEEMLAFGMDGVQYNERTFFVSDPLVGTEASLPGPRRLYLILLQSALHRHGVEFYDRRFIKRGNVEKKNCSIRYLEEDKLVIVKTEHKTERILQPDVDKLGLLPYGEYKEHPGISEDDFLALDRIAMQEAERIYRVLTQSPLAEGTA